ncbi:efflux RND transporter periplasmic adaptor subunit [Tepidibacter hydrothermalis]|uniref:Efflux RND transporter periplasmic adaptor subunit n=1 Tax=Tepidibacter hydrothermalis TaxID=3036126 RepID=A0ABY8EKU2_9FIRM|nr:efflux RND transporter periplasmic adaptor subunit [Tepidibacter hydrothermalis]WFD11788.1 efflux RND transporter periplasmic adaptor subunit [Tepidibacter hydrothermalis]
MDKIKNLKNKKVIIVSIILILVIGVYSIKKSNKPVAENSTVKARPVKTIQIKEETHPMTLDYIGSIETEEVKTISFKSPGKIEKIYVKEGQLVSKGSPIAKLDLTDLQLNLNSATAQMNMVNANYNKAKDDYEFNLDYYNKTQELYDNGGVSKKDLDQAQLKLDMSKSTLEASKAQYEQAKTSYELTNNSIKDATIIAGETGYIADVVAKEGENVNTGAPIVLMRPEKQIIHVGLSQEDVKKISLGKCAKVKIDDAQGKGKISNIDTIPDQQSRTYDIEIELTKEFSSKNFLIGSIANVSISLNDKKGVWLPINCVMSDGEEFVYIVEEDRIVRKNVKLSQTHEDKVLVEGLYNGASLVTQGMKTVKPGYLVSIQ